jgi:hypothetical protein
MSAQKYEGDKSKDDRNDGGAGAPGAHDSRRRQHAGQRLRAVVPRVSVRQIRSVMFVFK